jgi:hypothetical protein
MLWPRPHNPAPYDDDWEDQPGQGPVQQWGLGVLVPLVLAGYGLRGIVRQEVLFGGTIQMTFHGLNAAAFGVAWVSAAVFLHCHYFWGNVYNQAWFAVLGKIVSACGFIGGLGLVLVRNGVLGIQ